MCIVIKGGASTMSLSQFDNYYRTNIDLFKDTKKNRQYLISLVDVYKFNSNGEIVNKYKNVIKTKINTVNNYHEKFVNHYKYLRSSIK